jgi:hypothetical protein
LDSELLAPRLTFAQLAQADAVDMALSAEEWSTKVAFYEKVADDESAARELRMLFARKSNWLRILARLQARGLQTGQSSSTPQTAIDSEALLFSPTRLTAVRIRQWRIATRQKCSVGEG